MPELGTQQEFREEAERLSALPQDVQRQIIAMHWADANNPRVPEADREYAKERADALEKFLGLSTGKP